MKNRILFLGTGILLVFSSCGGGSSHPSASGQAAPLPPLSDVQTSQVLQTLQSVTALQSVAEAMQNQYAPAPAPSTGNPAPATPGGDPSLNPNQEKLLQQALASGNCQVSVGPPPNLDPSPNGPAVSGTQNSSITGSACPIAMSETSTVTSQFATNSSTNTYSSTSSMTDKSSYSINLPQDLQFNDVSAYQMTVQSNSQASGSLSPTSSSPGSIGGSFNMHGSLQSQSLGTIPYTGTGSFSESNNGGLQSNTTMTFQFPGFVAQLGMTEVAPNGSGAPTVTYTINGVPLTDTQIRKMGTGPTHSGLMSKLQFQP